MKNIRNALLAAAAIASVPALAQQPFSPWYIGAGVGQGHLSASGTDLTGFANAQLDTNETTYTIRTGWRFSPFMALELGYYDLGKYAFHGRQFANAQDVDGEAKAKSVGLSFVGILPLDPFELYGRIGYARSELKVNASAPLLETPLNHKDKQNEATYGVGGRWTFIPHWALFAEWMKNDKIKIDSYLIGIDYKF